MQDPVAELPSLINQLLQAPAAKQRALIERYYTPDCKLTHALVLGRDREDIVRIFQSWRFCNVHLEADVQEIFLSREGDKVFVQLIQHVTRYLHGPLGFDLGMTTVLYLRDSPSGKLICKQVDLHQFESILYHWPLTGRPLELGLRGVLSWQMTKGAAAAAWGWGQLGRLWKAVTTGFEPVNGQSVEDKGERSSEGDDGSGGGGGDVASALLEWAQRAAGALWWREWFWRSWRGRLTVPYSMR